MRGSPHKPVPMDSVAIDRFEASRDRLASLAYRLLGSAADAEDAVRDTFLRWRAAVDRTSPSTIWKIASRRPRLMWLPWCVSPVVGTSLPVRQAPSQARHSYRLRP